MTSRRYTLVGLVLLVAWMLGADASRAQQPAPPDAAQLYAQMTVAMQQAGSVHIRWTTAALSPGPRQTIRAAFPGSADISSQQHLLRAVLTTRMTAIRTHKLLFTHRSELVAVGDRYAGRTIGSRWYCQTIPPQELGQYYALTVLTRLPVTPHFIGKVTSATVLGVAVWRVKIYRDDTQSNPTDVLNIAQDSHLLVRITRSSGVKTAADGVTKTFADFSRYGEAVTAQLPQACR